MKDYGVSLLPSFQCFMGQWEGLCKTFDAQGSFLESSAVHIDVYWVKPDVWHLHEHFEKLYGYGEAIFDIDLQVVGKTCLGVSENLQITGVELTPDNYIFTIASEITQSAVFNNHYFLNSHQRRVITHKLRNGQTYIFQIQDFSRV